MTITAVRQKLAHTVLAATTKVVRWLDPEIIEIHAVRQTTVLGMRAILDDCIPEGQPMIMPFAQVRIEDL